LGNVDNSEASVLIASKKGQTYIARHICKIRGGQLADMLLKGAKVMDAIIIEVLC